MTREEEIYNAMGDAEWKHIDGTKDIELFDMGFKEGAEWADRHPHWISVEDELPEQNRWVLAYNGTSINLLMLAGNGNWYDHSVAQHRNVTHWMLVEPPEKLSSVERIGKNCKE